MKILQISFHTAPFGSAGKYDSGGLNIYVEKISNQLAKNNHVTVVTAEKAESFVKSNLEFKSLNLFDKDLSVEDKEVYLQEFINKLNNEIDAFGKVSLSQNLDNKCVIHCENATITIPSPWLPSEKTFLEIETKNRYFKEFILTDKNAYQHRVLISIFIS